MPGIVRLSATYSRELALALAVMLLGAPMILAGSGDTPAPGAERWASPGTKEPALATPASLSTGVLATDLAEAIAAEPGLVTGAAFESLPPSGTPVAVADSGTALGGFPTSGSTYGILTSGDANLADDPDTSPGSGADNGGPNVRGDTDFDVVVLRIDIEVPAGDECLSIQFRFLSEEFPEFVNSQYNDALLVELDQSTWTTSGSIITAPDNFAFDENGNPITINAAGAATMTAAQAAGTTYDGATALLQAQTQVTPGPHSIYLTIFDQGDQALDSAAFLDKLDVAGATPGCQGVTPVVPGAPQDLVAFAGPGSGEVTLGWSPPPDDGGSPLTQYHIYRGAESGALSLVASVASASTSFVDVGVPASPWLYAASAQNAQGEGPASNEAGATPFGGETVTTVEATLPTGRKYTSAIWDGTRAYVFGGNQGSSGGGGGADAPAGPGLGPFLPGAADDPATNTAEIIQYDPATDTTTIMGSALPDGICCSAAVFTGAAGYIFGGTQSDGSHSDSIFRYDPTTDTLTPMAAALPDGICCLSAVWNGQYAYIFGGLSDGICCPAGPLPQASNTGTLSGEVLRYDPASDTITSLGAILPDGICCSSAVWAGQYAFLFGGTTASGETSTQILRFDPATNTVQPMAAAFPGDGICCSSAVFSGAFAYVFGGVGGGICCSAGDGEPSTAAVGASDVIFRYDPVADSLEALDVTLPDGICCSSAAWGGDSAFIFGGETATETVDMIVRLDIAPAEPAGLAAASGPGLGEIRLSWGAPADDGTSPVTGYRVSRGSASGTETFLADAGNVAGFTDTGLTLGATYYYRVSAVSGLLEGALSNEASDTPGDVPGAPGAPSVAAGPGSGEMTLTWTAPADDGGAPVDTYNVYRGMSPFGLVATVSGATLSFVDTGLTHGQSVCYKVAAITALGAGPESSEACGTVVAAPGAPLNLRSRPGIGVGEITLTWGPPAFPTGTAMQYRVYRGETAVSLVLHAELGNNFRFVDEGLAEGATFHYQVRAVIGGFEGEGSNIIQQHAPTPPTEPTNVRARGYSQGGLPAILIEWGAPVHDGDIALTRFTVYRGSSADPASMEAIAELGPTAGRYVDDSFEALMPEGHYYRVTATNPVGEGPQSTATCAVASPWSHLPDALEPTCSGGAADAAAPPAVVTPEAGVAIAVDVAS